MGHVENGNVWVQDNLKSFQICYGIKYLMKIGSVVEYTHLGYNAQGFPIEPVLGDMVQSENGKNINWEIVEGLQEYFHYY